MTGLDDLKAAPPEYTNDLTLNLGSLIGTSTLPEQRLWGTVLATAIAARSASGSPRPACRRGHARGRGRARQRPNGSVQV